jgi:thiamine-phosphate pyrophosphorylase
LRSIELKKRSSLNWKLYVITDREAAAGRPLSEIVAKAILGGADVVQLRDKKASDTELLNAARELLRITRPAGVPLVINDRVRVALESGADGLHLGQDDGSLDAARAVVGDSMIIGRSTHSPSQALGAEKEGFDYIGVGPVFQTPTKPTYEPVGLDLVRFAAQNIRIPFVAIGGIDEGNAALVRRAGASTIAVVRAVMASPDAEITSRNLRDLR